MLSLMTDDLVLVGVGGGGEILGVGEDDGATTGSSSGGSLLAHLYSGGYTKGTATHNVKVMEGIMLGVFPSSQHKQLLSSLVAAAVIMLLPSSNLPVEDYHVVVYCCIVGC